jgi:hypothetical protein
MPRHFSLISLLLCVQFLLPRVSFAQQKFTISGFVKDGSSGESMIAATMGVRSTTMGATTNNYGFLFYHIAPGYLCTYLFLSWIPDF